jgi:hypothetical protein
MIGTDIVPEDPNWHCEDFYGQGYIAGEYRNQGWINGVYTGHVDSAVTGYSSQEVSYHNGVMMGPGGHNDHPTSLTGYYGCPLGLSSITEMQFPNQHSLLKDPDIWIGDSAASTHSTGNYQGMYNLKDKSYVAGIRGIDGNTHKIDSTGDLQGTFHGKLGTAVATVCLQDVSYSPANAFNLISIPQLLVKGWILGGLSEYISVTSPDGVEIKFDIVIKTPKGQVYAACMKRLNELTAISADGTKTKIHHPNISINEAHAKYGHCSQALTCITAKHLKTGIIKSKPFRTCTACGMGKAKQKNVPKSVESDEPAVGEHLHGDISTICKKHDNKSYVRPNWFMLIDAATGMKFSSFWNTKSAFIEPMCEMLHHWLQREIPIKFIRVDNARENKKWEAHCQSAAWKFPFKFEYTAARTPQQNSKVEVGFAVIANQG